MGRIDRILAVGGGLTLLFAVGGCGPEERGPTRVEDAAAVLYANSPYTGEGSARGRVLVVGDDGEFRSRPADGLFNGGIDWFDGAAVVSEPDGVRVLSGGRDAAHRSKGSDDLEDWSGVAAGHRWSLANGGGITAYDGSRLLHSPSPSGVVGAAVCRDRVVIAQDAAGEKPGALALRRYEVVDGRIVSRPAGKLPVDAETDPDGIGCVEGAVVALAQGRTGPVVGRVRSDGERTWRDIDGAGVVKDVGSPVGSFDGALLTEADDGGIWSIDVASGRAEQLVKPDDSQGSPGEVATIQQGDRLISWIAGPRPRLRWYDLRARKVTREVKAPKVREYLDDAGLVVTGLTAPPR